MIDQDVSEIRVGVQQIAKFQKELIRQHAEIIKLLANTPEEQLSKTIATYDRMLTEEFGA